jgi:hypothetical protein
MELTYKEVNEILRLDLETGKLYWKVNKPGRQLHKEAGHCDKTGYRRICINYKMVLAHRIFFLLTYGRWPYPVCDHIDRNPRNNKPTNLRECHHGDNMINSAVRRDNTTGAKGLYMNPLTSKWEVRKRGKHIGAYYDKEEAIAAYEATP